NPAGSFGARYACADPANTQIYSKRQQGAPTPAQLEFFYHMLVWLSGSLDALVMGPQNDRCPDDRQLVKDWMASGSTAAQNRAFWAIGNGLVESNEKEGDPGGFDFAYLGAGLNNGAYQVASGITKKTIDLPPANGSLMDQDPSANVGPIIGVR